jgi:hypothetical protein
MKLFFLLKNRYFHFSFFLLSGESKIKTEKSIKYYTLKKYKIYRIEIFVLEL